MKKIIKKLLNFLIRIINSSTFLKKVIIIILSSSPKLYHKVKQIKFNLSNINEDSKKEEFISIRAEQVFNDIKSSTKKRYK